MFKSKSSIQDNIGNTENLLKDMSLLLENDILNEFDTSFDGYNEDQIEEKIDEFGENIIEIKNEKGILKTLYESVVNPFNMVLIVVAIVTFITDVVISKKPSYETFILILSTIVISSGISFRQQDKSNKAAEKLQNMISNKVDVIRNGKVEVIDIKDVVPGDIVKLSSGDMLPGDVRFLRAKDLFIDQSSLTGESNPVEKFEIPKDTSSVTSISNIGFMGTNVVSGSATGIVLTTGNRTYFGSMAKSLSSVRDKSSFEKGVDSVSNLLIKFMLVMVPIIFVANLITKDDWVESLLFGITIAVGLTPEMLPVIMTTTLAKGAIEMSKEKTIVKRLGSIQAFGEMDILCTDKTGTLTEDKIILEKYIDVRGNDNPRILRHAFMNSYFQTGLKNLIDVAIISRAEKENLEYIKEKYNIEDEIPFDFSRRRMSVVLKDETGKRQLVTKGAVDEVVSICSFVELDGDVVELTEDIKKVTMEVYEKYNNDGLRVVAVAQKNNVHDVNTFGISDESEMVLIGFVGFLDPPKESSKIAIEGLKKYGVDVVVLTGDTEGVALNVCSKVGIEVRNSLIGTDVESMTDDELKVAIMDCHLYSKLSPFQKQRIVRLYQEEGHTVGYMGDGINDSPPMKQSDVGISVDTAVDIAKETADIILLEKDLRVLEKGVVLGRRTFANISKYLRMATSGNFGNMISVIIASIFLPFLPLLPIHILIQNLLCDFAQIGMPFDNVDGEYIEKPRKWNIKGIRTYMFFFGLISSVLDILCFLVLWYILKFNTVDMQSFFQTGWFLFGIISQTLIIHMIRTHKVPFVQSFPSKQLVISTLLVTAITLIIGFTSFATIFDLSVLPIAYLGWLAILMGAYALIIQFSKKLYIKINKEWL